MNYDPRPLVALLHAKRPGDDLTRAAGEYCRHYGLEFSGLVQRQWLDSIDVQDFRIALHHFLPDSPRGKVVLVHGYHDHHGLYSHLIRYCLERRLAVLCFDLPGHGLSSGPHASIEDFDHYQQTLKGVLTHLESLDWPGSLHLMGQSTGAAILSHYLLSQRPEINGGIILLAPLVRPARWSLVRTTQQLLGPWIKAVPRQFTENSHDPEFLTFLQHKDPLQGRTIAVDWVGALRRWIPRFRALPSAAYQPLIIQGQEDQTVDWRFNLRVMHEKFPGARVHYLPEGRHHLANESAPIRHRYQEWLDRNWEV